MTPAFVVKPPAPPRLTPQGVLYAKGLLGAYGPSQGGAMAFWRDATGDATGSVKVRAPRYR